MFKRFLIPKPQCFLKFEAAVIWHSLARKFKFHSQATAFLKFGGQSGEGIASCSVVFIREPQRAGMLGG